MTDQPMPDGLRAKQLVDGGQYAEALALCEAQLLLRPGEADLVMSQALAKAGLGQRGEALGLAESLARAFPTQADAIYYDVGVVMLTSGDHEGAVQAAARSLAVRRSASALSLQASATLRRCGASDPAALRVAEALTREAVGLDPDFGDAHFLLALSLSWQDNPVAAETSYRRAAQLMPTHLDCLRRLAGVMEQNGRFEAAEGIWRRLQGMGDGTAEANALNCRHQLLEERHRRDPQNLQAMVELAEFRSRYLHLMDDAIPLLNEALARAQEPEARQFLLEILFRIHNWFGRAGESMRVAEESYRLQPSRWKAVSSYACRLEAAGRNAECSAVLSKFLTEKYQAARDHAAALGESRPVLMVERPTLYMLSFGDLATLDVYVKARRLGHMPDARLILNAVAPPGVNHCNRFLFDLIAKCAAPDIEFVFDSAQVAHYTTRYGANHLPLAPFWVKGGDCLLLHHARPALQQQWNDEGREPVLRLPDETRERGWQWLAELGVPRDAWFVTLHARNGAYFPDNMAYTYLRNSPIESFLPAIEEITARGGWVVLIGDVVHPQLPPMERVIDYPRRSDRQDWKDVFLLSECRFMLGSNSGPIAVAMYMGTPFVGVDWFTPGMVLYARHGLLIHKLLRNAEGRFLTIRECNSPELEFGQMDNPNLFRQHGIEVLPDTPEDIAAATREMMDRLDGVAAYTDEDQRLQDAWWAGIPSNVAGNGVRIGRDFLRKYDFLCGGG